MTARRVWPAWSVTAMRVGATLVLVVAAVVLGAWIWHRYLDAPWTRDGRVRAYAVAYAPEVSGTVTEVNVIDNQRVHIGDVLFRIDSEPFQLAVREAVAQAEQRRIEQGTAAGNAARRAPLEAVLSDEERGNSALAASGASASYQAALAALGVARYRLRRTVVRATVNGYVTNLELRVGDYATEGRPALTVVDEDSFWVTAYLEETKVPFVRVGDPATVELMGVGRHIQGHIESIGRGIADENAQSNALGLPNVNPVFTWVRLAQRIPVRVHLDVVPRDVLLANGQTCTVRLSRTADRPR
ncbi:MAG TPA: HlyD family secretion protein [Gemmatimonadaceae bacterium]|jgi:multidrug resistance efflux pump|nr:HlyD family secretion protein [Gemmatimonadaceae bacterium]